jgi:DNA-binding SARP family transcriptional activator/tetratricopeptide (TPR) repeat protein
MNGVPLLKAKLTIPEIPGRVLFSGRIKNLNIAGSRAVIITAPAGFGKTTSVLLSLRKHRDNMLWYRMEREDSFLPVFFAHLIEALLGREDKDATDSARSLASIGKISEEYPLLNAVICQDAWTQYPDHNNQIYLVFDDFQNVADNTAIVETVKYFISNLPPNMRIIVMSRVDTGIRTGKLILNEDILLIDEDALRFSKEEIAKLTSDIYKIKIDSEDIHTMHEYSEGWIAGITLLLHAAGSDPCNLGKLLTHGNRQDISGYLLSEAFGGTGKDMMKTLASISILPDFTCDDLKAVFNMEDAAETIAWLEKNNIYIQKTETRTTSYRFHSLFRSALLSVLNELFTPVEINRMNLNAAHHYKSIGDFNSAIRFLIAAGRADEAIGIASAEGVRFMDAGDTDRVTSIVQAFPEEWMPNNPYLLFLRGASLMSTEIDQSYAYLYRSFMSFRQSGNLGLQTRALGLMISISYQKNDLKSIKGIISLINKFKAVTKSRYARVTLLISAFMNAVWSDKLVLGDILYKLVERQGFYEPLWDYTFKMAKVILLYRKGDLEAAREIIKQLPIHPVALANDHWRTIGLVSCHNITSLMGDTDASQKLIGELASLAEKYNSDYALGYALRLAAYTKYQTRDIAGAVSRMEESASVFARYGSPIMDHVQRITKYLWKAEYEAVEPLAEKVSAELNHIEALKPGLGFIELCWANAGALFKEAGRYAEAEGLLAKAYRVSKGKKARQNMCGAAMHLADLYYRKKEYTLEEKYLRIWGKTVADKGYVYFREMNYPTLVRVCARCIEKNISPDYMLRIIGKYFNTDNAARLAEAPAKTAADPKAFISSCSPPLQKAKMIRIKLLGSFKLVVDDVEIGEREWKTRKICGILKYILANPEKTVSREALAATFWPESDSKAAYTSLRVALFELRKILARFGMAFESEDALIAEGKNGFYLCSRNTMETDADKFAGLYGKYKSGKLPSEEMKALLIQMIELYKGDFLEDDSYDEWVELSREHYKSIFIEVSHKLAGLYIAGGEPEQAETLLVHHMKVDPFDEKACSILIHLYDSTGRKNQASSLRRQFEKRFEAEMGVKPDL